MHDIETEQMVIGFALMNNASVGHLVTRVLPQDFFEPLHQEIWKVIGDLVGADKKASAVTLRQFLPAEIKGRDDLSVKDYLARCAVAACLPTEAVQLADSIRDMAHRRELKAIGEELGRSANGDPAEAASWAVEALDGIVSARQSSGSPAVTMRESVVRAVDATAHAFQNSGKVRGLSYGLAALDDRTLGAAAGELIVIAGRPGMGKTALALGIARNIGLAGHSVFFYSAEMVDVDLTQRMIADHMWQPGKRMTYWQMASGRFHENIFHRVMDAGRELAELPIRIEQQPGLMVSDIAARARHWKRRHGLKAMVVDHLGLVKASGRYAGNKVNETGEITTGLKALAKELEVPIFLLCQINRGVESRDDKRPTLADLRNSGDIEQDADTVLILYRAAYYLAKKEPPAGSAEFLIWTKEMESVEHRLEVAIEKQRRGPVGTVRLFCDIACNVVRDEIAEMDDRRQDLSEAADFK
jgi:replicative DNA helicase